MSRRHAPPPTPSGVTITLAKAPHPPCVPSRSRARSPRTTLDRQSAEASWVFTSGQLRRLVTLVVALVMMKGDELWH